VKPDPITALLARCRVDGKLDEELLRVEIAEGGDC